MTQGHPEYAKATLFVGDVLLTALTILLLSFLFPAEAVSGPRNAIASFIFALTFLANFYAFGLYDLTALNGLKTVSHLVMACSVAALLLGAWCSFVPWLGSRRNSLMVSGPILVGALYVWRRVYTQTTHLLASREPILVVGGPTDAETVRTVVDVTKSRYELVGFLRQEQALSAPPRNGGPANGELVENVVSEAACEGVTTASAAATAVAWALARPESKTNRVVESTRVAVLGMATAERLQDVVLAYDIRSLVVRSDSIAPELASVLTRLRFEGIRVYPLPDFYMRLARELPIEVLSDTWLSFAAGFDVLHARFFRRAKRLMDLLLASMSLLLSLPILLLAAIIIKLDSRGPVLFRQWRVGWMGRPFQLLKLRSMRNDAESDGRPQWASVDDPRTTRVGKILRSLHMDELPQMVNILRGEMSFVGPRPERPEFMEELTGSIPFYHLRHYVLPGITGWAQVKHPYGASMEDARRKLQFDLYYIRNASPLLDLKILLRTARVLLFREGSR